MKYSLRVTIGLCLSIMLSCNLFSQNYHAYNGSPYAGVFSLYNNPASTVNTAFRWDVNIFSLQGYMSNKLLNVSGISGNDTIRWNVTEGAGKRYLHGVTDAALMNLRFNIGKKTAVAFALRGRSYNHLKTDVFNWNDTVTTLNSFMHNNTSVQYLQGFTTHAAWVEADFNISRVLREDMNNKFAVGVTIGYMRNLSGAFASLNRVTYTEQTDANGKIIQTINGGTFTATYSNNYDLITNSNDSIKTFLRNTLPSFNFSLGAEWLFKQPNIYEDEPITNTNYDWKIGVSILDIGKSKFNPAQGSFIASIPKTAPVNETDIERRFKNLKSLQRLRDSVNATFSNVQDINDIFSISTPTRLLISIDRNFGNNFYTNAQLNINFYSTEPINKIHTRELNGLTITPRWEKKNIGFYMPVQLNTQGNFLVGGAVKLGPLLIGLHNLGWLFGRLDKLNGGGYIAIHIKAKDKAAKTRVDCAADIR